MDYDRALDYMSNLLKFGVKLGNERFEELLRRVGSPHVGLKAVHVAGTNGKGSTTSMCASVLRAAGYRVGGYYSPYVFDVRERILVDGEKISKEEFGEWVGRLVVEIEALRDRQGQTTEFELKTAVAFLAFARAKVDYAAVEVGMGGRLDATNVITPASCVITNIGLDHTEYLGDTHAKIAFEKAGIIKPGVPVVTAAEHPDAIDTIRRVAADREAPLTVAQPHAGSGAPPPGVVWWRLVGPNRVEITSPDERITVETRRLVGAYQAPNAACAVTALRALKDPAISDDAIREGIANAWLPGRLQTVRQNPRVLLDGAHNTEAAEALAHEFTHGQFAGTRPTVVLGMARGHDPAGVISAIAPLASRLIITRSSTHRALPAEELATAVRALRFDCEIEPDVPSAVAVALNDLPAGGTLLVTGSFYTLGDYPIEA